ncbi:two component transcriptional regulator, LuxR family [Chitinophaga sp. YR627]|uniref:response regulator transcription factor n=1 Tax=Chitinophaga sp. YR627 TaxID=1881041 RepID=UPI0008ECD4D3|nr:response regulator transcription factor [Chitinophaga sp. YR627]SFO58695.1 two component transcriptional regulator, LuxR family [Chitinophaga sp. YR627]
MRDTRFIAIADDHAMLRKGLEVVINMFPNHQVLFTASDGDDLIKQLDPNQLPDIVLMDISMPGKDGYQTTEYLKEHYPEINVLAVSTLESEAAIIKMIKHGARGYVLKDADPSELKIAFDEILSKGYYYNELITRKVMQSIHQLVDDRNPLPVFAKLTDREIQFLKLACSEKTYQQIAKEMFVSERTVDGYRDALFKKLEVTTRVGLVMFAIRNKLVDV